MTARLLEAVPNFSEGRSEGTVGAIVAAMADAGADVLDWSSDADHHRSVVTVVGSPEVVEEAAVRAAAVALEQIDLRRHEGLHPRIGALDVLPFVPLSGLDMAEARASARRVGRRLAEELRIPVYFYGQASDPPGRSLAALRRGGFEALHPGWPPDRSPDLVPPGWTHPGAHPTAGATCIGARQLLLAWNVFLTGVPVAVARSMARALRERDGGFRGLRALGLELPSRGAVQISMNLEDLQATSPMDVFRRIEALAAEHGGSVAQTEIIGMVPDGLLLPAAAERLALDRPAAARLLSRRLVEHLARATTDRDEE